MKQYVLLTVLCFASSILGSVVTVGILRHTPEALPRPESTESEEPVAAIDAAPPGIMLARRVVLVDERGGRRMELAVEMTDEGEAPIFAIYDEFGISKWRAGIDTLNRPYLTLANSELPNPDHKRIALRVDASAARLEVGHGEIDEILIQSAPPSEPAESVIRLRARNSSNAGFFVDEYGHATLEVMDNTTKSVLRAPERTPLIPE